MPDPTDLTRYRTPLIFGGTFDPPHLAHVELPRKVAHAVAADAVLYVPAARSPHKIGSAPTAPAHRLAMLHLALRDQPRAVVLTDELDRDADDQPSYTIDTLTALRPRLHLDAKPRLLIGTDQARAFHRWRDWQKIENLAEPVVMLRPPENVDDLPAAWRARVVALPVMDISSTAVRRRLRDGLSTDGLLDPRVARYIAEHGLYGA